MNVEATIKVGKAFNSHHLNSMLQFPASRIEEIFALAKRIEESPKTFANALSGKIIALLFFQPSTRTRLGYDAAAKRLGAQTIGFSDVAETRSAPAYGEKLSDVIQVVNEYSDAIVLRHFQRNAIERAAQFSRAPVINAGNGAGEHPVQALADIWLLHRLGYSFANLRIGFAGDPFTRVVRSMILGLLEMGTRTFHFVLPTVSGAGIPNDVGQAISGYGGRIEIWASIGEVLPQLDVLHVMPFKIPDLEAPPASLGPNGIDTPAAFKLTRSMIERVNPDCVFMHPGPTSSEIAEDVNDSSQNLILQQVRASLPMRMAVLLDCLTAK